MAIFVLTTSPTQIDDGTSKAIDVTNTGMVNATLSTGAVLKPGQCKAVLPSGTAVTATASPRAGQTVYYSEVQVIADPLVDLVGGGGGGATLPSQTSNAGKILTTDGSNPSWAAPGATALIPTAVKTANYTAAAGDFIPVDTTSGAVTVTLPTAPADKTRIGVKHVIQGGTNTITIACGGSDVFNKASGSTSATLSLLNQSAVFQYASASGIWYVQSGDLPLSGLDIRYDATQRLIAQYGKDPATGLPQRTWPPESTIGPNMWALANFSTNTNGYTATANTSTLTPSLAGGASAATTLTRITIPGAGSNTTNDSNQNGRWRFRLLVTAAGGASGQMRLRLSPRTTPGAVVPWQDASGYSYGTNIVEWTWGTGQSSTSFPVVFEVDVASTQQSMPAFLDLALIADAGTTGGSISVSGVSVYAIPACTPPIRVAWDRSTGGTSSAAHLFCDVPIGYDVGGNLIRTRFDFGPDSTTPLDFAGTTTFMDVAAVNSRLAVATNAGQYITGTFTVNNSDSCITVYNTDNTSHVLGNTHGGEAGATGTYTTDVQIFLDYQDGNGWTGPYLANSTLSAEWWRNCYRVKIVTNTAWTRSDQGSPFLLSGKTFYVYRDGTMRQDRTFTFQQDQKIDHWFWHMSSFNPATGLNAYRGKLGAGLTVLASMDASAYLPAPLPTGSATITGSGGSIPANVANQNYSIRITALDAYGGEGPASIAYTTAHCSAGSSQVALTWGAVTGASAYAVYFGFPGYERRVATTTNLTYTVTGTEIPGQEIPRRITGMTGTQSTMGTSSKMDWSIYYDPLSGAAFSMAIDRASVLAMPNVAGVHADLQRQDASLMKNYWSLWFTGNDAPITITNGTVYSGTVWWFFYMPSDPLAFERDQAPRASSAAALPTTLYPST